MVLEVKERGSKLKFMLRPKGLRSEGNRLKAEVHVKGKGPS